MGNAYIFSLQPTFTQGLILGQLSILCLLVVVLKYLFFDAVSNQPYASSTYSPVIPREDGTPPKVVKLGPDSETKNGDTANSGVESADWLNILLHQVYPSRVASYAFIYSNHPIVIGT